MTSRRGEPPDRLLRAGVTEREAEVLWAVAERLRNREIAERLFVSVRTVESHIAALLRKLGAEDRAVLVKLGVELRQGLATENALPAPLTSLVGRETETAALISLLEAHRLITLIGPAGVGKTRLALHVSAVCADRDGGGVRTADLAPVQPALVGDAIARALGVVPEPGWGWRDTLREVAAGMSGLVLLDNCEHVVAEVAGIVADLLGAGGRLRVLATSREPLGVPGEVSYQVPTLPVPSPSDAIGAEGVRGYDAVRLFVDRAVAASPGFELTDAVAPAVGALCRRLDGLPLAIELAASRTRSFAPAELVGHLDRRFDLLSDGARTALPRHRTLRGAIDWSYALLDDDERALFDRLGVFPADFAYEAVESLYGSGEPSGSAVIAVLPRLVDKSLVATVGRNTRRYRLLETIRSYAAERLAGSGVEADVRRAHAHHYSALAERAAEHLRGFDQRAWVRRMTTEQPNLRAAWAFAVQSGEVEAAWRLIAALARLWDVTGQRREAHAWITRTLAMGDPPATPEAVRGLVAASGVLQPSDSRAAFDLATRAADLATGLDEHSRATAERAVAIGAIWIQPEVVLPSLRAALSKFGDDHAWDRALTMQALANASGPLSEALQWGRDSVALFRRVGDQLYAANTLFIMAQRAMYAGVADDDVHRWLKESQELAQAAGSDDDIVHATVGFGQLAWLRGDHERAAELMRECLPTLRRLSDRRCAGRALYVLGVRAQEQQDLVRAEQLLRAAVESVAVAGQSFVLVQALEALAAVLAAQDQPRAAVTLLGTADSARVLASGHMRPIQPPDQELSGTLSQALGQEAFDQAHREGGRLSPTEALQATALR